MADSGTPVTIGAQRADPSPELGRSLGEAAADVIRLHMAVIDREDRLESGTGAWLSEFLADRGAAETAVREAVLRLLHTATERTNFSILEALPENGGVGVEELGSRVGLGRLTLAERVADLVSAGLAMKIPEANQVARTGVGTALVALAVEASETGGRDLRRGAP